MKVLYYCPEYYDQHGGRTHARGFYGALQKLANVEESFLYPKGPSDNQSGAEIDPQRSPSRIRFLPLPFRRIVQFFIPRKNLTNALIAEITSHNCDVLIARRGTRQLAIKKIKEACPNISVCLEINSAYFDEHFPALPFRSVLQRWEVSKYRQADSITVVSSYLKEYLVKYGVAPEKVLVNQNGVDIDITNLASAADYRKKYSIPDNAFVIGYIGGMERFRRLPEVVSYIATLRRAGHTDLCMLVVGDGTDMPAIQAAIETEKEALNGSVILTGWRPYSEVSGFLSTFNLAIFPFTNAYCSPLKLFEYLGAGIPTLGPDTPAVREVFTNGVHLKLVKQDGSDFTSGILALKADPELRKQLACQGRQLVLSEYTWKKNAERVIDHILHAVSLSAEVTDSA